MRTSYRRKQTVGLGAALLVCVLLIARGIVAAAVVEAPPPAPASPTDTPGASTPPSPPFTIPLPQPYAWPDSRAPSPPTDRWPSSGPPAPTATQLMPNLYLMTREAAVATLTQRHLRATQIDTAPANADDTGLVVEQSPAAGTPVDPQTAIIVSLGAAAAEPAPVVAQNTQTAGHQPVAPSPGKPAPPSRTDNNGSVNTSPPLAPAQTPSPNPAISPSLPPSTTPPSPPPQPSPPPNPSRFLWWALAGVGALAGLAVAAKMIFAATISVRPGWDPLVDTQASPMIAHAGPDVDVQAWLEPGEAGFDGKAGNG